MILILTLTLTLTLTPNPRTRCWSTTPVGAFGRPKPFDIRSWPRCEVRTCKTKPGRKIICRKDQVSVFFLSLSLNCQKISLSLSCLSLVSSRLLCHFLSCIRLSCSVFHSRLASSLLLVISCLVPISLVLGVLFLMGSLLHSFTSWV
jgi:hypothetical protein